MIARRQLQHVIEHDPVDPELTNPALADDRGVRRAEHRQLIERLLGPQLLDDPDGRVGDQHHAEKGVLEGPDDEYDDEEDAQYRVEAGEDVGPEDLRDRARRCGRDLVDVTTGDAIPDRRLVQADELIDDRVSRGRPGHGCDRVVVWGRWGTNDSPTLQPGEMAFAAGARCPLSG